MTKTHRIDNRSLIRTTLTRVAGLAVVAGACVFSAPLSAHAAEPATWSQVQPDLRFEATFQQGEARADQAIGDNRMSRVMWARDYSRFPWDGTRGRVSLPQSILPAPFDLFDRAYVYEPRTDASFRLPGHLNTQAGTFSVWVRRSELFDQGGRLFEAKTMIAGGPRSSTHWLLAVGDNQPDTAGRGHLYLATDDVSVVANKPMADLTQADWVHLAAVWDAEAGAALYVNGQLAGKNWKTQQPAEQPEPVYQADQNSDPLHQWRISRGTESGRGWFDLSKTTWQDVTLSHQAASDQQPGRWAVQTESQDRLQLRSPRIGGLTGGHYRLVIRYRQQLEAVEQSARGMNVRLIVRWAEQAEPMYVSAISQPTSHEEWRDLEAVFQVPDDAQDAAVSMDLQITHPGRYEVAGVTIFPAQPGDDAGVNLLSGHGRGWSALTHRVIPTPVQRLHIHPQPEPGAMTNIRLYDAPLTGESVAMLANPRLRGPAAVTYRPHQPDQDWRLGMLGWETRESGWIDLQPGQPVRVSQAVVQAAYEDKRAAGWLAVDGWASTGFPWWYHGYRYVSPRRLHVAFDQPTAINYLVTRGSMAGQLHAGGLPDVPEGDILQNLSGFESVGRHHLDEPVTLTSLTAVHDGGTLTELQAYRIDHGAAAVAADPGAALTLHLHGDSGNLPLPDHKLAELLSSYRAADRSFLTGKYQPGRTGETRAIVPLQAVHLFSPTMAEDYPLDGMTLRLHTQGLAADSRVHVRVHDSFDPWRELGRFDFLLQADTDASQPLDVTLKLRPTLIRQGDAVWVTLYFESAGELVYAPKQAESSLILHRGDEQQAKSLWLEWTLAGWRTAFEALSEPRSWNRGIASPEDGWWLQVTSPEYEQMVHAGRELMARYPDEPRVRAWFNFIHPNMPNPAADLPLPQPQGHPRWAELARANLKLYHQFTQWWTVNRAHENGELGNFYGDDTDLMQEWPDMAMIHDPDGKLRHTVLNLADGIWNRFMLRGLPLILQGVNSRWTDALHAYEDGLNIAPMSLLLDYGNPILFERLLETGSRYADGYLLKRLSDNQVQFNSQGTGMPYWDYQTGAKGSPHHHWWFLMTHPGLAVLWYNGHPGVHRLFNDLANWKLGTWDPDDPFRVDVPNTFFAGMYLHTGDERYLTTIFDPQARQQQGVLTRHAAASSFDGSLIRRIDPGSYNVEATLAASREQAATRFDVLGTPSLGYSERRFESNWVEWYLSRDKQYLEEGLAALYRRLKFTMPALTVAEQSGDRVAPPRHLISQMYLGGVVQTRNNHFYPDFALSYEGLSLDFAGLVTHNTKQSLSVVLYNFEDNPQTGQLRVWQLEPGRYQVRYGLDTTGDDRIDQLIDQQTLALKRAARVPITLPAHQLMVVEITQIEADPVPLYDRPDLAIHPDRAVWQDDGSLAVRIDNIGSAPAADVTVRVVDQAGNALASRIIEHLDAPLDFQPRYVTLEFPADALGHARSLEVQIDPNRSIKEVYRGNNQIRVTPRP